MRVRVSNRIRPTVSTSTSAATITVMMLETSDMRKTTVPHSVGRATRVRSHLKARSSHPRVASKAIPTTITANVIQIGSSAASRTADRSQAPANVIAVSPKTKK
jgi:hypothetical protein